MDEENAVVEAVTQRARKKTAASFGDEAAAQMCF